jgi:hypothetical protein
VPSHTASAGATPPPVRLRAMRIERRTARNPYSVDPRQTAAMYGFE